MWYRKTKYNNKKTVLNGIKFDSEKEAVRWRELQYLEKAGDILELKRQPTFTLQEGFKDKKGKKIRPITYRADFMYYDKQYQCVVVEDSKGFQTPEYKLKKKMFKFRYPDYIFLET